MIHFIRTSRFSKILASYLALQLVVMTVQPTNMFALTGGPAQPEFNSFTPIGTSDMVNLASGDFNYNIPIMDVGGYPLNLAYNSGITMDQEASWVGLGWNLNVGQIARSVRGVPDDFDGDEMRYENDARENVTLGISANLPLSIFGEDVPIDLGLSLGLGVEYNNLSGFTPTPSIGVSYKLANSAGVGADFGVNISSNINNGPTVTPSIGLSKDLKNKEGTSTHTVRGGVGIGLNSRQGIQNLNLSTSVKRVDHHQIKIWNQAYNMDSFGGSGSLGGGVSFDDQNYTPKRRAGLNVDSYTFNVSGAPTFFGVQLLQGQFTGYGSYQQIKDSEKDKLVPSFGYEHTEGAHNLATGGILDVNRENDVTVNKNTNLLPNAHYTYDMYAIQGQGIGGSFRPYRGQVGYIYDNTVSDDSDSDTFGFEGGLGNLVYAGAEFKLTNVDSRTQRWADQNFTLPRFNEHPNDPNPIQYETSYYKMYGGLDVDNDIDLFTSELLGEAPIHLDITGSEWNRRLEPTFVSNTDGNITTRPIPNKLKRSQRHTRNQSIHHINNYDAQFDPQVVHRDEILDGEEEAFAKPHHTVGMKVMKPDGSTYVYGESVYNTKKVEATFDVSGKINTANCEDGTITYNTNLKSNRGSKSDGFINRVTTPAYAHTYLLNEVLSADYEDLTGDGPTDDDLGAYTRFYYNTYDDNYKWRIPFEKNKASYNEGLKSSDRDDQGNYVYGEKELKYIQKIETKTHIAFFKLSNRADGRGVKGERGGIAASGENRMQKLDKIYLFSKPEYSAFETALENDILEDDPSEEELMKATIKIAHFEYEAYDYSNPNEIGGNYHANGQELCKRVPNNAAGNGGKLTLKKVYFTYRGSYMGKHTPYTFNYADFDGDGFMEANPDYNMKGYDVWGCYKPNEGDESCSISAPLTTSEYPFVEQNKSTADAYTRSWSLSSIDLPSGGQLEIQLEADDYQYVQERQAMQMFKVVGAGDDAGEEGVTPQDFPIFTNGIDESLYQGNDHHKYLYVKLSDDTLPFVQDPDFDFVDTYLKNQVDAPIFFRFLLNMKKNTASLYDYVEGYFLIDQNREINVFEPGVIGGTYAAIPMEFLELEGVTNNDEVNPISKAGWYFGRSYLNRLVYGSGDDLSTDNFGEIIGSIFDSFESMAEIVQGPNKALENKDIARDFIPQKSWIRLLNPNRQKFGGGCRVTSIRLHDQWDDMTSNPDNSNYLHFYGQEYDYSLEDGTTSGVASFEPNASKENPYVEPFYSAAGDGYRDKIVSPRESNYVEKPIGASFYPSPTVTYGRVTVRNLERTRGTGDSQVTLKKHATGKVVTEHFTCKDFPTISRFTILDAERDNPSAISQLFKFSVKDHYTMAQGFVVETNDMSGKMKRQQVFAEDKENPISGVEYTYSTEADNPGQLKNALTTIDDHGNVSTNLIGMDYEVINDFREHKTNTETGGVNANLTSFLAAIIPNFVVFPVPTQAKHENQLRTASTMKHIHKNGIMVEKKAFDLGSTVTTKNLAWDSETGQVLLTKTINEYDDDYFNLTYPVHWYNGYKGMGQAAQNINMQGVLTYGGTSPYGSVSPLHSNATVNVFNHFIEGDEVLIYTDEEGFEDYNGMRYWVAGLHGNGVALMDREGKILNECGDDNGTFEFRVVRSGYRNQQAASMASVTSMINPIDATHDGTLNSLSNATFTYDGNGVNPRIVNASAVEYKEQWLPQEEYRLASFIVDEDDGSINNMIQHSNPYLYNVKAEWRALKSYAYLTGRNFNQDESAPGASPRREGFFDNFQPFYQRPSNGGDWTIDASNWTFASEVAQYSPYGAELENRDALDRFSGAQYGYNYTLPTAVASNSKYSELGFDGFEDYNYSQIAPQTVSSIDIVGLQPPINSHFSFQEAQSTPGVQRRSTESHSGSQSLLVAGEGNEAVLERHLNPSTIEARVTCVEPPVNSLPNCSNADSNELVCPGENRITLDMDAFGNLANIFGDDGPAEFDDITFLCTNYTSSCANGTTTTSDGTPVDNIPSFNQFNSASFFFNPEGDIVVELNEPTDDLSGKILGVNLKFTDGNGDSCIGYYMAVVSTDNINCDSDGNNGDGQ